MSSQFRELDRSGRASEDDLMTLEKIQENARSLSPSERAELLDWLWDGPFSRREKGDAVDQGCVLCVLCGKDISPALFAA